MQLLIILSVTGVLSGLLSGGYVSGGEGMVLGASAGLVAGVITWTFAGIGLRTVREYRLNKYFDRDDGNQP
jgi:outer membrane lipoprotein SlyB